MQPVEFLVLGVIMALFCVGLGWLIAIVSDARRPDRRLLLQNQRMLQHAIGLLTSDKLSKHDEQAKRALVQAHAQALAEGSGMYAPVDDKPPISPLEAIKAAAEADFTSDDPGFMPQQMRFGPPAEAIADSEAVLAEFQQMRDDTEETPR